MAKGQKRSNREIRKPKQEKTLTKPAESPGSKAWASYRAMAKKDPTMNINGSETGIERIRLEISIWEDEGGAQCRGLVEQDYGRRIETDRSWSIYHVFTGVPAVIGGRPMTSLTRADATVGMLLLNSHNERRRRVRPA